MGRWSIVHLSGELYSFFGIIFWKVGRKYFDRGREARPGRAKAKVLAGCQIK